METSIFIFWIIAIVALVGFVYWFVKSNKKEKANKEAPSTFSAPENKENLEDKENEE